MDLSALVNDAPVAVVEWGASTARSMHAFDEDEPFSSDEEQLQLEPNGMRPAASPSSAGSFGDFTAKKAPQPQPQPVSADGGFSGQSFAAHRSSGYIIRL
jgi:hypothetical protein